MRTFQVGTLALATLVVGIAPAQSQERERMVPEEGAVRVMLLRQRSVRDALKLTDTERDKIHEFTMREWDKARRADDLDPEERQQRFAELTRENERFLDEILTPEQRKRLDQIALQVTGLLWVTNPEVAAKLKLTDEQKTQAKQYQKEAREEMQKFIYTYSGEVKKERFQELRATSRRRLMDLLTDEQETKWKEMIGEPFHGEFVFETIQEEEETK